MPITTPYLELRLIVQRMFVITNVKSRSFTRTLSIKPLLEVMPIIVSLIDTVLNKVRGWICTTIYETTRILHIV